MANMKFTVEKATQTQKKDGYILKLVSKEEKSMQTPFGLKVQASQTTFYMKTQTSPGVGFEAEMNPDDLNVIERPHEIMVDEERTITTDGVESKTTVKVPKTIQLKWLHLK
jgi:hypothetical protein